MRVILCYEAANILVMAFLKDGAGRFWKDEGRMEANPRSSFNHHHGQLTVPVGPAQTRPDSRTKRKEKKKPHLLLVSLNNEAVIWINGPPARLTLIMASLITQSQERNEDEDEEGGTRTRRVRRGFMALVQTSLCLWFCFVDFQLWNLLGEEMHVTFMKNKERMDERI